MDHWQRLVRGWSLLGPPLRPSPTDVAYVAARIGDARRGLVLGVTPELVALPWPGRVVAVERDRAMIAGLYRGGPGAIAGDWRALPLADAAIDLACGDGCLTVLPDISGYAVVARELARVLVPGGRVVLRAFVSPAARESLSAIARDPGGSFHALKWRIAMAIGARVAVTDVRRAFDELFPDRAALVARTGWDPAVIAAIDAYAGSTTIYTFPRLPDVVAAIAPALRVTETLVPGYELGDRCPTLVLERGRG